jgi:hypothetical protein
VSSERIISWTIGVYKAAFRGLCTAKQLIKSNKKVDVIIFITFSRIYVVPLKDLSLNI